MPHRAELLHTRCRIFIDLSEEDQLTPRRGDCVVTMTCRGLASSSYLILRSREVHRREPAAPRRFTLDCKRITFAEAGGRYPWLMRWYPRKKRKVRF